MLVALDGEETTRRAYLRRMRGKRFMPVPGDIAYVRLLPEGETIVESLAPREISLTRRTVGGREKTMAANVDTLVTVTSLADPPPRTVVLDQLIAFTELQGIAAIVVLTKPDLATPRDARHMRSVYRKLDYPVVVVDPKHGTNVDGLRALLADRRSLLCGVSGVGKSSIFRALGGSGAVKDVSRRGLGRQTTTAARLCRIEGGFLIDSPGVAEFGLGQISPRELAEAFVEMSDPAQHCRFGDCTHLHEPDCGVQAAVASGAIEPSRYASYRQILGAD
jgi:ribosome biogenesis GTPase / thiamine phosphate phosphatase